MYICIYITCTHIQALVAKDGAVATLDCCQLVGSTLYATSGGLIHIDATQLVESVNDSIIVDCDGVVKARNSKVIGVWCSVVQGGAVWCSVVQGGAA